MAASLLLIRHGETAWSLTGRHTGRTDVPLTERGEQQAARLGPHLSGLRFSHVFTSPRQRARRTAELAGFGPVARAEPDLAEWDYGAYEGRTSAEIRADQPGWNVFRDGCPSGETVDDLARRADRLLARLRPLEGTVLLFSHGHFLRALAVRWIGLPVPEGRSFALETGSISLLGYEHGDEAAPVIMRWNTG